MLLLRRLFGFGSIMGTTLHEYSLPDAAISMSGESPYGTLQKMLELLLGKSTLTDAKEYGKELNVLQQADRTLMKNFDTDCLRTTFTPLCLD